MERSSNVDSTPKKRKNKAQEENVEKPKKPRSAYLLYYFDVYQVMQLGSPIMPQSEINKRISESWKRLSVAEKSYYLEKAKLEKEGVDTSSLSPSKDPPGFRKILPRASYYIMSKDGSTSYKSGGLESESLHSPTEGDVAQDSQFSSIALAGEVEVSEPPIIVQDIELETTLTSPPLELQGLPSSSSSSEGFPPVVSTESHFSQKPVDLHQNAVTFKTSQARAPGSLPNVLQALGEPGQMVAFIPSQNLLKVKSLVGPSSVGPVMVVSVGAAVKQSPKPSYKMPVKTYTRRGRGKCQNPGCSFIYLSRHKPTTCPDCGSHLGGKWIPAAKRLQQKEAASQQTLQTSETEASSSPADKGFAQDSEGKREEQALQICDVQPAHSSQVPPGGSSTTNAVQTNQESQSETGALDGEPGQTEHTAEKSEGVSPSLDLQGTPSPSSSADTVKTVASTDLTITRTSADLNSNEVIFKTNETLTMGAKVQQISTTQPTRTCTRRGRGRCPRPGCSFIYVSRHKPTACPDCGSSLGGKWISSESRIQQREPPSQQAAAAHRPAEGSSTKKAVQAKPGREHTTRTPLHRNPVRPILPACYNTGHAVFHIITVPPEKSKFQNPNCKLPAATAPREKFPGLKPSTLRQLGQAVPANAGTQGPIYTDRSQPMLSLTDKSVNVLPVVPYKQHTVSRFDLGLSTARGRGCCKNPSCNYMYKNRHKPAVCPKCGCGLTQKNFKSRKSETLLDPHHALSPAQKDIQRQNTVQLLRSTLQIPESESELQDMLTFIQEVNHLQVVVVEADGQRDGSGAQPVAESGWPLVYESAATYCGLCNYPLFKGGQSTVAGQEECRLLTETLMQTVTLQLKVCLNAECLALHSFTDLHPGLFNIGNKLLVTFDLLLKIRANIKLGQSPSVAARTLLDHNPNHPVHALSPAESSQIQDLLLSGYWAFECLTVRDYNDMICGICGISPKIEIAQRHRDCVLELKNVEFTWPEIPVSDEVHVDDFWLTMENEAIEQAAFPTDIPITRVDASIIAPFTPPLMRSPTVINTEKEKVLSHTDEPSGDPSVLVRLIHDGELRLNKIEDHTEDELRTMLSRCGVSMSPDSAKADLLAYLLSLCTLVQCGLPTWPQPPAHNTAGKLSKLCPHKVVSSSKYLVRGETARDHVDLLLSSRYWPPVYVCDCARQVALCTDMQYPELATQMWGRNQGCFSDPLDKPEVVSCAELQEQPYSADLSLVTENQQVHPITRSSSRWLVVPPAAGEQPSSAEHHSMLLCRDLEPYISQVSELEREKTPCSTEPRGMTGVSEVGHTEESEDCESVRNTQDQPTVFSNAAYYYLYNRLVDFLSSRDIVNQQINQVVETCQMGEVVIRDALYRLGVAQLKTEEEEEVRK